MASKTSEGGEKKKTRTKSSTPSLAWNGQRDEALVMALTKNNGDHDATARDLGAHPSFTGHTLTGAKVRSRANKLAKLGVPITAGGGRYTPNVTRLSELATTVIS